MAKKIIEQKGSTNETNDNTDQYPVDEATSADSRLASVRQAGIDTANSDSEQADPEQPEPSVPANILKDYETLKSEFIDRGYPEGDASNIATIIVNDRHKKNYDQKALEMCCADRMEDALEEGNTEASDMGGEQAVPQKGKAKLKITIMSKKA